MHSAWQNMYCAGSSAKLSPSSEKSGNKGSETSNMCSGEAGNVF